MADLRELLQKAEDNGLDAAEAYLYSIEDYDDMLFGGHLACGLLAEHLVPAIHPTSASSAQASPAELQVILSTHYYLTKHYSRD